MRRKPRKASVQPGRGVTPGAGTDSTGATWKQQSGCVALQRWGSFLRLHFQEKTKLRFRVPPTSGTACSKRQVTWLGCLNEGFICLSICLNVLSSSKRKHLNSRIWK